LGRPASRPFITSEAHTKKKTPEQFKETHVDIDRIYAENLTPLGVSGEFVTQEDVLNAITASSLDDPNRIFILRGEPGSGKSQLCEWTKYQINGYGEDDEGIEDRVALHVSRSQTRMDQILDILTEPLDVDTDVRNIDDLDPDDAAAAIVEYLRGIWSTEHPSDEEIRELTEARGDKSDLREIFAKNIREYQEALESRDENPDFQPPDSDRLPGPSVTVELRQQAHREQGRVLLGPQERSPRVPFPEPRRGLQRAAPRIPQRYQDQGI